MRFTYSKIVIFILLSLSFQFSFAGESCVGLLTPTSLSTIDKLAELEKKFEVIYVSSVFEANPELYTRVHREINELIEKALLEEPLSAVEKVRLNYLFSTNLENWVESEIWVVEESVASDVAFLESFELIEANKTYEVIGSGERALRFSFTSSALNEILDNRVTEVQRSAWLKALKKGIVGGSNQNGIKLMKTSNRTFFAEIKAIGRSSGSKRIYGLQLEDGSVEFMFVAGNAQSGADLITRRLMASRHERLDRL